MTLGTMTTRNLFRGQEDAGTDDKAPMTEGHMGRFKMGPNTPQATLRKLGVKVGDPTPKDTTPEQLERWKRRGYLVPIRGPQKETTQAGEEREEAAPAPHQGGLTLDDLEKRGAWYYFPGGGKVNGKAKALERLAELNQAG